MKCKHVQYGDMMLCETCAISWDTNDSYPPQCPLETTDFQWLINAEAYTPKYWTFPTFAFDFSKNLKNSFTLIFILAKLSIGFRVCWKNENNLDRSG